MVFLRQHRYYFFLGLALILSIVVMANVITNGGKAVNKAIARVDHSNLIISTHNQLSIEIERTLSSRQGYILSGDKKLAARYEENKAAASALIAQLSTLMEDDSAQISRLNEEQHHFLTLTEKLGEIGRQPSATAAKTSDGTILNDLTRVGLDIVKEEQKNLEQHTIALKKKRQDVIFNYVLGCIFFFLLLGAGNAYVFFLQTMRNQKERNLNSSQEIFRLASEGSNDGIFEWRFYNGKAFYSKQFWAMLGYTTDQFPDTIQSFKDLLHPEDKESVQAHIDRYLNGEISEYLTIFRMKHQSGKWIWINARGRALYNDEGKPTRIVGAHTDISAIKAYEEKLQKAKEYAESANRAKTDFLAHMSHEIRTPLTAISGIAEILEGAQSNLTVKQKQMIKILNSSTSSLKDLVNDILDFSRIESGELELDENIFNLHEAFDQVISIVSLKATEKNLNFAFDYSEIKKQKFLGDRTRLRQILLNLISNAIKFTNEGDVIVHARKKIIDGSTFLQIDVKDTGIGIDSQHFDLIFERFKQADSSVSRKYGGSGLGLPISLRLARLMGGDITVESILNQGSVFTLIVPFKTPEAQETHMVTSQKASEHPTQENMSKNGLNQKNVLLVEDYEGNIVVLSYLLDSLQCQYDIARTGLEALNMWKKKRYNLILMDVQMPEMDGFTATAQIRRMEQEKDLPRVPIIGMTAHAMIGDKEKCIEAGMDTYLPKPIVENDLKTKIIEFLGHKKAAA